jgi:hypothetical protein
LFATIALILAATSPYLDAMSTVVYTKSWICSRRIDDDADPDCVR